MAKILRIVGCLVLMLVVFGGTAGTNVRAEAPDTVSKVRLVWDTVPDAVMYELILTRKPGKVRFGNLISSRTDIYTAGVEIDLASIPSWSDGTWWQVRALNIDGQPISPFSTPQKIEAGEIDPQSPLTTARFDRQNPVPLYLTYSWIPVLDAAEYEVQILSSMPDDSDAPVELKKNYTIKAPAFDCYDEEPYTEEGTWWWRVRAGDDQGQPLGSWSEAIPFTVSYSGYTVAAFGDSVTHGGGAVSNPPSDPLYDWTYYVGTPIKNLGRSGDTTQTMAERFDSDVLPFAPQILIIMGGINDIRGGATAAEVTNSLQIIRDKCIVNGIIPVHVTISPVNPSAIKRVFDEDTYDNWQSEWIKVNEWVREQPYYIDTTTLLTGADGLLPAELAADGLHPDTKGKALIGRAVRKYLRKNFELRGLTEWQ